MNAMTTTERTKYDAHVMACYEEQSIARASKDAHVRAYNLLTCELRDVAADAFEQHGSVMMAILVLSEVGLDKAIEIVSHFQRSSAPQVGDIVVSSWGYDQTNVDYYQVIKVTKSSVQLREIANVAGPGDTVKPAPGTFLAGSKPFTRRFRIEARRAGWSCSISDCASGRLWDGTPDYVTPSGMGH